MPRPAVAALEQSPPIAMRPTISSRGPASSGLRLTRRGRVVFGALLLVLAFIAFGLGRVSAGAAVVASNHQVTVHSGDTLWSIASRVAPSVDPRAEVAALQAVNHLADGVTLEPGENLSLPTGS